MRDHCYNLITGITGVAIHLEILFKETMVNVAKSATLTSGNKRLTE